MQDFAESGHQIVILPEHRLVYTRFSGPTAGAILLGIRIELLQDRAFDPTFDVIVDLRDADLSPLSASDIRAVASRSAFGRLTRRVIVADTQDKFGLARMYQTRRDLAGGREDTHVVTSLAEALEWLRLDPNQVGRLLDARLADP